MCEDCRETDALDDDEIWQRAYDQGLKDGMEVGRSLQRTEDAATIGELGLQLGDEIQRLRRSLEYIASPSMGLGPGENAADEALMLDAVMARRVLRTVILRAQYALDGEEDE